MMLLRIRAGWCSSAVGRGFKHSFLPAKMAQQLDFARLPRWNSLHVPDPAHGWDGADACVAQLPHARR
jgi:hypothetical protein